MNVSTAILLVLFTGLTAFSVLSAQDLPTQEDQVRYRKVYQTAQELFVKGELEQGLLEMQKFFEIKFIQQNSPVFFCSNIPFLNAIRQYTEKGQSDKKIAELAKKIPSQQVRFALYFAWARVEEKRARTDERRIKDAIFQLQWTKNERKMLETSLEFNEITKAEFDQKAAGLQTRREELEKILKETPPPQNPLVEVIPSILKIVISDPDTSMDLRNCARMAILTHYNDYLQFGSTPENDRRAVAEKMRAIFCTDGFSCSKRDQRFLIDAIQNAYLTLGIEQDHVIALSEEALKTVPLENTGVRSALLIAKYRALLQKKDFASAKLTAQELKTLEIKTNPLAQKIKFILKQCEDASK